MRDQHHPRRGDDLQRGRPETMPQRELDAADPRVDRVAVPPERHAGPVVDNSGDLDGCRIRDRRQRQQHLGVGELTDGWPAGALTVDPVVGLRVSPRRPQTGVAGGGPEPVEADLRLLRCGCGHGAPPTAAHELHAALHRPLAVATPGWARHHDRPVVLRHRRERGLHIAGARSDHGGQTVGAPPAGGATEAAQHPVDRFDQMRLIHRLAQHLAGAARMRQRPQQPIRRGPPRRVAPLRPVPLDLLARGMIDLHRLTTTHPGTRLTVRTQTRHPELTGETRIRTPIAERHHLVEQR
jgi:hypothetical protein